MRLIDDARDWWRLWSVRLIIIAGGFSLAADYGGILWLLGLLPKSIAALLPWWLIEATKVALFVLAGIARLLPQKKLDALRAKRANP